MPSFLRLHSINTRSAVAIMARATLDVISELERNGCRVLDARVLPQAAIRVDRAPDGLDTWGHLQPPRGANLFPTEHVTHLRGVRVTWFAAVGRQGSPA